MKNAPVNKRRITPRPGIDGEVKALFVEIVGSVPPSHFTDSDGLLVEQYAQSVALARKAYAALEEEGPVIQGSTGTKANPWLNVLEKAHRSSVALAARLRLAPQSRLDPKTAGRSSRTTQSAYERME